MTCYEEIRQFNYSPFAPHQASPGGAIDTDALDSILEHYGSEAYISSAVWFALHGSHSAVTDQLINYATELIDWDNPPEPLVGLLQVIDHEGVLKTGDPAACRALCRTITQIHNAPYHVALFSVFAYYLQQQENGSALRARLAEEHLDILRQADRAAYPQYPQYPESSE